MAAEVHAEGEDEAYPLEDVGKEEEEEEEEEDEEDEEEEEDEDAQDPDFDAMIEEGVKAGHLRVKVRINSSG